MTDNEFIAVFNAVEKEAARYKKRYGKNLAKEYGGTPDWLELTQSGLDSFKKNNSCMFDWCYAYKCAKLAIKAKYYRWKSAGYYEPRSLTHTIKKGEFGLEYSETDFSNNKRILIYGKDVSRICKLCNKKFIPNNNKQKYCSGKCRVAWFRKINL